MFVVVGTVPDRDFPIVHGTVKLAGQRVMIGDKAVPVNRGTPALLAASVLATETLGIPAPYAFLVGDIGYGAGSRHLYKYLTERLHEFDIDTLTFHYLQPIAHWHNKLLAVIDEIRGKPVLIADAGFMYAAKMSGYAERYDLFTPDIGELAFLADESAPHPFYTRGFILHDEKRAPELISRAYAHKNAARNLLVKGECDYVVNRGSIVEIIDKPSEESMEAIGGTGDTLTGIVSALIAAGLTITDASVRSAVANRLAGCLARPTPASTIMEIISHIPASLQEVLAARELPFKESNAIP
ncbi:MAG: NAD(P)H-hydrate dehydratase [Syntrophaceae bacterium]